MKRQLHRVWSVSGSLMAVSFLALPAPAAAQKAAPDNQRKIELAGFGGWNLPGQRGGVELLDRPAHRLGSITWGGRFTYWATRTWGVEITGGYSTARFSRVVPAGRFPRSTDEIFGAGKAVLNLTPRSSRLGLQIGGGLLGLHIDKTLADPAVSTTKIGAIGGGTVHVKLMGAWSLRGDAEAHLYSMDNGQGSKFQSDFFLTGGIALAF